MDWCSWMERSCDAPFGSWRDTVVTDHVSVGCPLSGLPWLYHRALGQTVRWTTHRHRVRSRRVTNPLMRASPSPPAQAAPVPGPDISPVAAPARRAPPRVGSG